MGRPFQLGLPIRRPPFQASRLRSGEHCAPDLCTVRPDTPSEPLTSSLACEFDHRYCPARRGPIALPKKSRCAGNSLQIVEFETPGIARAKTRPGDCRVGAEANTTVLFLPTSALKSILCSADARSGISGNFIKIYAKLKD